MGKNGYRSLLASLLLALGLIVSACSDGSLTASCQGDECTSGDDGTSGADGTVTPTDVGDSNTDWGTQDTVDDFVPGGFGDPCVSDAQCSSGFCIIGIDGAYICTVRCLDTCDEPGYACQLIEASGADLVRICYPVVYDLCKPCAEHFECGGLADMCVEINEGMFCGADCQQTNECPDGFDCRTFGTALQCVPSDGICSDCFDRDGDGYGEGAECLGSDCNDLDHTIYEDAPELCDFKDNDCDNFVDDGIDTTSDPDHCGACNRPCDLPNAEAICVNSTCYIQSCDPGFYDLDDEDPGCEYECVDEDFNVVDVPDRQHADTNCDGVDGDVERSVFVSGSDGRPDASGVFGDPTDEIWRGIAIADESPSRDAVLVAEGSYTGEPAGGGENYPLQIVSGVHVYGGYDGDDWSRSVDNLTLVTGSTTACEAIDITEETILGGFTFLAETGGIRGDRYGENSIGMLAVNADELVIEDCVIEAGNGGPGDDGDFIGDGGDGSSGGIGGTGSMSSSGVFGVECQQNPAPARGNPGASPCSAGGYGGYAGRAEGDGSSGQSIGTATGGGGGDGGTHSWGFADDPGEAGDPGCEHSGCTSVPDGTDGDAGTGGNGDGQIDGSGMWFGDPGDDGDDGGDGNGGGGGGGGGGATGGHGGLMTQCDGYGGAGGGGGGGGCGGHGGTGGFPGGGSFGLYLIDSAPTVVGTEITSSNGGGGGRGGNGGRGGFGAGGGNGGGSDGNGGDGGKGGEGTDGGEGGDGGGGGGGVSFAVFLVDSSDANFDDVDLTWGDGGAGGSGSSPGTNGNSGAQASESR